MKLQSISGTIIKIIPTSTTIGLKIILSKLKVDLFSPTAIFEFNLLLSCMFIQ